LLQGLKVFKRKHKEQDIADPELHFTILEIIGLSYSSFIDPAISLSLTYFDRIGVMESIYCEFNDVKKFELLEDKISDEQSKIIDLEFVLVDENIPAFFVSYKSNYLRTYVAKNNLEKPNLTEDFKHYIIYGNTGGVAHIVTPKAPKLSEL